MSNQLALKRDVTAFGYNPMHTQCIFAVPYCVHVEKWVSNTCDSGGFSTHLLAEVP